MDSISKIKKIYESYKKAKNHFECATNTHTFKCKKFGSKHIITGKIENEFALICRTDSDMCGKKGIHFIKKDANANSEKQGSSVIWYHPDE